MDDRIELRQERGPVLTDDIPLVQGDPLRSYPQFYEYLSLLIRIARQNANLVPGLQDAVDDMAALKPVAPVTSTFMTASCRYRCTGNRLVDFSLPGCAVGER